MTSKAWGFFLVAALLNFCWGEGQGGPHALLIPNKMPETRNNQSLKYCQLSPAVIGICRALTFLTWESFVSMANGWADDGSFEQPPSPLALLPATLNCYDRCSHPEGGADSSLCVRSAAPLALICVYLCVCVCEQAEQVRDRQIMIAMDFLLSFARPALRNCCLELVRRLIDELRRERKLPTPRRRLKEKQKNSSPLPFVPRCPDCSWHASITCRASDSYRVHPGRQES